MFINYIYKVFKKIIVDVVKKRKIPITCAQKKIMEKE